MPRSSKPLRDPLGNAVQLPSKIRCSHDRGQISQVITAPAFMIQVKNKKLCFFRLITWEINLMVVAHPVEKEFIVSACVENPTTEYISSLLRKGALISFQ